MRSPGFDDIARSDFDAVSSPRSHLTLRPLTIQEAVQVVRKNRSGWITGNRFIWLGVVSRLMV